MSGRMRISTHRENRELARQRAYAVAHLLESKAVAFRHNIRGEPPCLYRVSAPTEKFWFKILFSHQHFLVEATHRRIGAFVTPFVVCFKRPFSSWIETVYPELSAKLGVVVYTASSGGPTAVQHLCTSNVRNLIRRIDFEPIRRLQVNTAQLHAYSEWRTVDHCASQVLLFKELLETLHEQAHGDVQR